MEPQDFGSNKSDLPLIPPAVVASRAYESQENKPIDSNPALNSNNTSSVNAISPQLASDKDLMEKEWAEVVKKVMLTYRADPYTQNKYMILLRADYLKKRYDKDIKIPEN